MTVIMLDIDDCLSTDRSILACKKFDTTIAPGYRVPLTGDTVAIGLINRVCWTCDAQVVVVSTWLHVVGWAYTRDWLLNNGLNSEHFHQDPAVRFGLSGDKRMAILDWLKRNPLVSADDVCVVDDDRSLFHDDDRLRFRQIVVEGEDGIRLSDYRAILRMLGGFDGVAGVRT